MPLAPPRSLSPSKVSAFTNCPLVFRLTSIDRLPEPPSPQKVKGTLVHAALERLFWYHGPGERSLDAGRHELEAAWADLAEDAEFRALQLGEAEARAFHDDAALLVRNYFALEDPDRVPAVAVELGLEADVDSLRLRGIVDRLDRLDDGQLVVIDYKTGRAPSARFEHSRLSGVHIYALLCELVLGRAPIEVRLLYLRDPVTIAARPTAQSVTGQRHRTSAIWQAIERACANEDFRPRPSPLCRSCHFQPHCPAFGGTIPVPAAS